MKKFFGTPSLTYVFLEPFLLPQSLLGLDKATFSFAIVKVTILEDCRVKSIEG